MVRVINEASGEWFNIPESDLEIIREDYFDEELDLSGTDAVLVSESTYESIVDRMGV